MIFSGWKKCAGNYNSGVRESEAAHNTRTTCRMKTWKNNCKKIEKSPTTIRKLSAISSNIQLNFFSISSATFIWLYSNFKAPTTIETFSVFFHKQICYFWNFVVTACFKWKLFREKQFETCAWRLLSLQGTSGRLRKQAKMSLTIATDQVSKFTFRGSQSSNLYFNYWVSVLP